MKRLLIIETDEDSLSLLKQILEEQGHNVMGASHVENAFEILRQGIAVDLVLLSTVLENAERLDIIEKVRSEVSARAVPIIAITSSARTNEGPRAVQAGCAAFISKPIDEAALLEAINNLSGTKD